MKLRDLTFLIAILASVVFVIACGGGKGADAPAVAVKETDSTDTLELTPAPDAGSARASTPPPISMVLEMVSPELLICVKTALGDEQYNAIITGERDAVADQLGLVLPCIMQYPQEANAIMEMFGLDTGIVMAASTPIPNIQVPSPAHTAVPLTNETPEPIPTNTSTPMPTPNPTSRLIGLGWNRPTSVLTTYLKTADLSDDSVQVVEDGIRAGEDYLGSYGPLRVYVIGTDVDAAHIVAEDFCSWAYGGVSGYNYEYCVESDQGVEIREIAEYAGSNAFAQHSRQLEAPNQSFVIGNPLQFESGLGSKIAIHEYVHIYQNANKVDENDFGLPLWLEEGSAEFLALYLGQKEGWADYRMAMAEALESAKDLKERYPDIGIQDIETSESRDALKSICDCTGMLQYETGQWATAWLVNRTSLDIFYKSYIPDIVELGGHGSFEKHFGLTVQEFYGEFDEFMSSRTGNQSAILPIP